MQGTSMASPHVAGVVALMQSVYVNTPAKVSEILQRTATAIPGADCPGLCGGGRIDVVKALAGAVGGPLPTPPSVVLRNGIGTTVTAGSTGSEEQFVLTTYSGAGKLTFNLYNGTGNADMYVNYGSRASLGDFDCSATGAGNTGTCTIDSPAVGAYYVMVRGAAAHTGAKVSGTYASRVFVNKERIHVPDVDLAYTSSPIFVHGRAGNAPATAKVSVTVYHTWSGDLELDLRAPDGTIYPLRDNLGGSAEHVIETYVKDLSSELANGTWRLRVRDTSGADVGHIHQWSLTF
jgi:serine protease